jgi:hypothetical protein
MVHHEEAGIFKASSFITRPGLLGWVFGNLSSKFPERDFYAVPCEAAGARYFGERRPQEGAPVHLHNTGDICVLISIPKQSVELQKEMDDLKATLSTRSETRTRLGQDLEESQRQLERLNPDTCGRFKLFVLQELLSILHSIVENAGDLVRDPWGDMALIPVYNLRSDTESCLSVVHSAEQLKASCYTKRTRGLHERYQVSDVREFVKPNLDTLKAFTLALVNIQIGRERHNEELMFNSFHDLVEATKKIVVD